MYQVIFGNDVLPIADYLVKTVERFFKEHDLFVTLSTTGDIYEDFDIVQEEFASNISNWLEQLGKLDGWVFWNDEGELHLTSYIEAGDSRLYMPVNQGNNFVILFDVEAIIPVIVMPENVFNANRDRIMKMMNQFANDETVDLTAMFSPALFIEVDKDTLGIPFIDETQDA